MLAARLEAFAAARAPAAPRSAGPDELSARELEVLRAIAGPGSLREVADALYISRNTIKTHTRALYAKLGAGTRADAVRRGRELGLLGRSSVRKVLP
ncbi:MAG TPA: LuxR C-terminal-related transcriptional regulator [Solirubrobacteraceae bacterium]|nr:LuxR C-terminal-related transcriptional regulator [Solirubrobacteraceae bacterium]